MSSENATSAEIKLSDVSESFDEPTKTESTFDGISDVFRAYPDVGLTIRSDDVGVEISANASCLGNHEEPITRSLTHQMLRDCDLIDSVVILAEEVCEESSKTHREIPRK